MQTYSLVFNDLLSHIDVLLVSRSQDAYVFSDFGPSNNQERRFIPGTRSGRRKESAATDEVS